MSLPAMTQPPGPAALRADKEARLAAHYDHCGALLHAHDRDRWLGALFAPERSRKHLHALYAFALEIARIRENVRDPAPGEIRMQWWIDAIEGETRGDVGAHPVANALIDTIFTFQLPRAAFTDLIEARRFDLYDDPFPDVEALETYCGHTSSLLFRLATIILSDGREPGGADAAGYAGVAYALTGLMRAFPFHAAQGRLYLPADVLAAHGVATGAAIVRPASPGLLDALAEIRALSRRRLDQAAEALPHVAPPARAAFAPLAVAPLYLKAMEQGGYHPFSTDVTVAQWRRQWAMWRFMRKF